MIIVVGAGLFGSIISAHLRSRDMEVCTIDDDFPLAGSKPAGCLLRPSWLTALNREEQHSALSLLDNLYGLEPVLLQSNLASIELKRVDPSKVLVGPTLKERVLDVSNGMVRTSKRELRGTVIVAAGVWTTELLPAIKVTPLYGVSARYPGQLKCGLLHLWAPYKQAIAYNISPKEIWFGDGTSIKHWEQRRIADSLARAQTLFKLPARNATYCVGMRPYVDGQKRGLVKQLDKRLWVATGGAKNGTALAALAALHIGERI